MTIEDAFNEFEKVLDEHFNAMNINHNNGNSPSGGVFLSTPCSSSDNDDSERTTARNELVVGYPPSDSQPSKLVVAYNPPLEIPSRPNLAIPFFLAPADVGVLPAAEEAGVLSANTDTATDTATASTHPPATYNLDGFPLHRKNNNKNSVQYWCNERRNKKGDCEVEVRFQKNNRIIDYANLDMNGSIHTAKCCQTNGVNTDTYAYLGKDSSMVAGEDPKKSKIFMNFPVGHEMKRRVCELATSNLTMQPETIWGIVKKAMDEKYAGSWSGLYNNQIGEMVRKSGTKSGLGNFISTINDTKEYRLMSDGKRPFLQASGVWPHPEDSSQYMRSMVFGNPALIPLLKNCQHDIFVDVTFVIMVYHDETSAYVPVLYCLLTHKNETLYWHVLSAIMYCSES